MKHKRYKAAASMTRQGMMVTGGYDGDNWLSSTEIFNGRSWNLGPEMPVNMTWHCQVTAGDDVIVAGEICTVI